MTNLRVYAHEIGLSEKDLFELEYGDLKIKFIDDFLFADINSLKRCNINISKLITARQKFINLKTKKLKKSSYYSLATYLPISIERLNKFLDGGLPANRVTELKGDRLSGKTLFCLNVVLDLIKSDKKLLFIDTDYVMNSNLFFDLTQEQVDNEEQACELCKKVDVCFVNNYQELIFKLNELILSQTTGQTNYDLVIIDSIYGLLASECFVRKIRERLELMQKKIDLCITLISKLLATSTILVTNSLKDNLPKIWTNRCDLILELRKEEKLLSSEVTFHLRTIKPFECLNSLSCLKKSQNLLNDLKESYIQTPQSSPSKTSATNSLKDNHSSSQNLLNDEEINTEHQEVNGEHQEFDDELQENNDSQISILFSSDSSPKSVSVNSIDLEPVINLTPVDSQDYLELSISIGNLSSQNSANNTNNDLNQQELDDLTYNDLEFIYKLTDKGSINVVD